MIFCINPNCSKPYNPDDYSFCQACGSDLLLAGRYQVIRLLSDKGGFAKTYEVSERDTLKVLKVLTNNHPHAIALFQQEAQILSQLNHPGIPQGEGSFTYFPRDSQTPLYCLVMEKIEGMDLDEYQKQHQYRPIAQKLALDWLFQLAKILHEVHRRNFFHRDIKPSNIILRPNGQLVLIDFGAVRQVTATILAGRKNTGIYTPGYAPPEQEKGYAVQQSDFFALGRTFIFLLTGKEPTDPAIYDHFNNELRWQKYAPQIAPQLINFIDELIAEKANQRPVNTSIILQKLAEIKQELYPSKVLRQKNSQLETRAVSKSVVSQKTTGLSPQNYAGFWLRFKASLLDTIIVAVLAAFLGWGISFRLNQMGIFHQFNINLGNTEADLLLRFSLLTALGTNILGFIAAVLGIAYLINDLDGLFSYQYIAILVSLTCGILFKWLYFILLEFSLFKATFGKMLAGIIVIDLNGKRLSFKRANKRYWAKLLSFLTLYIGFMLAGWTSWKRALHDMIAGTVVVRKK